MTSRSEALVMFKGNAREEALALLGGRSGISFEARPGSVRILAVSQGAPIEAMTSAALAALQLIDALKDESASIESVRLVGEEKSTELAFVSRGFLSKDGA